MKLQTNTLYDAYFWRLTCYPQCGHIHKDNSWKHTGLNHSGLKHNDSTHDGLIENIGRTSPVNLHMGRRIQWEHHNEINATSVLG